MRQRWAGFIAAGILLSVGTLAAAQPAAPRASAPGTAAIATPQTEAKVRRLMTAMHFERQIDAVLAAMLPVMVEQQRQANSGLTRDDEKKITESVQEVMRDKFTPELISRCIPIYAATYTDAEIDAMLAFYESPTGQAILEKTPTLSPKVAEIARELIPQVQADVLRTMCGKINCAAPAAKPRPKARTS